MSTLSTEFLDLQTALAGEYSLERELGRGGMGVVYLARDVQLDRHVAIKVLPAHLAAEPESRERFLREARTAAGLSHPNIVPIHRVGEAAGFVFFVMSFVPGKTLGERLREQGPLGAADAARVLREVAWALAYAHGRGIVHRDVKPDNILLEEESGRALVTDFGIAHVGTTTLSTDPGRIMGTAQFMSPEQAMSEAVDGRSDLYSLGAVGYLALSGKLPFEASNLPALLMKHVSEPARSVGDVAPGLPRALVEAIDRCLEKDPANRHASGEALAAALGPSTDGPPELPAPLRSWVAERNPATVAYAVWSGLTGIPMLSALTGFLNYHRAVYVLDIARWGLLAAAPLVPVIGFHTNRARRLFRAGFTLKDLRGALDVVAREREHDQSDAAVENVRPAARYLRWATYAMLGVSAILTFIPDVIQLGFERRHMLIPFPGLQMAGLTAWVSSIVLILSSNANHVRLLPEGTSRVFRTSLRERLWRSRVGEFLARRLGAPTASRPVAVGVFQATEMALGLAAAELFGALPAPYREELRALPSIVAALEARAAAARVELEELESLARLAGGDVAVLAQKRDAARAQLARSVAALEGIRVDLLRLHAGASDLSPLTTLLDAAQLLSDDLNRLTAAQQQVALLSPNRRVGAARVPTPM